jgi:hypothetical protein
MWKLPFGSMNGLAADDHDHDHDHEEHEDEAASNSTKTGMGDFYLDAIKTSN